MSGDCSDLSQDHAEAMAEEELLQQVVGLVEVYGSDHLIQLVREALLDTKENE